MIIYIIWLLVELEPRCKKLYKCQILNQGPLIKTLHSYQPDKTFTHQIQQKSKSITLKHKLIKHKIMPPLKGEYNDMHALRIKI